MRLFVIGGSGVVGRLILPKLAVEHHIANFDLCPFPDGDADGRIVSVAGDVGDAPALRRALAAGAPCDALIFLAMGEYDRTPVPGRGPWATDAARAAAFDVSVKGLYLALTLARAAGVGHAVYASSLSVYHALHWRSGEKRYYADEDLPADATDIYGLTKRLGEEVCRAVARETGLSVNALRLCHPRADDEWLAKAAPGEPTIATSASDTARAFDAALRLRAGYQAFTISGDYEQKLTGLMKARALLGWEPLARPRAPDVD